MSEVKQQCRSCLQVLPIDRFKKNNRIVSGYTKTCKPCANLKVSELGGASYKYAKKQTLVIEAKSKPCVDCDIQYEYYVMQFDHLPGYLKLFNLSLYRKYSIQEIIREIAKCEIVCSNCHAKRSYARK